MEVQQVSDALAVFPTNVTHLMPPQDEIPREFEHGDTKWNHLFNDMFFRGVKIVSMTPKEGIHPTDALRHIRTIMGSFEPQHEHKEAACAYLFSQWFADIKWERLPKEEA